MARDQAAAISCSVVANVIWVASFATKPDESRIVALADPPQASDGSSKALAPSIVRLNRPCRASYYYVARPMARDDFGKIRQVVVPCASRAPLVSVTRPSAVPNLGAQQPNGSKASCHRFSAW